MTDFEIFFNRYQWSKQFTKLKEDELGIFLGFSTAVFHKLGERKINYDYAFNLKLVYSEASNKQMVVSNGLPIGSPFENYDDTSPYSKENPESSPFSIFTRINLGGKKTQDQFELGKKTFKVEIESIGGMDYINSEKGSDVGICKLVK